ncbi:MAG: hypothetical protein AB7F32_10640 [Victivallaceae bacterium]
MEKLRRTKKVILVEEFARRINNGGLAPGSFFPNIDELMRRHNISSGTAGKVISSLGKLGLLEISRGRRTRVKSVLPKSDRPALTKPIALLSPSMECFRHSRWREWTLHYLQRSLLDHGNQSLWLADIHNCEHAAEAYSGFIVIGEYIPENLWQKLRGLDMPCVRLSFDRPYPDAVYSDYRPVMDRLALFLAERECKKILFIFSSQTEARLSCAWYRHLGFFFTAGHYGITEQDWCNVVISPDDAGLDEVLRTALLSTTEKMAIITGTAVYNQHLADIVADFGRRAKVDFEQIALSHVPREVNTGTYIDSKCELIVDKLIDLFYRRCLESKPQIAEIVYPEFISN